MENFTFHDMELKYGPVVAYSCLVEIEKAANIRSSERVAMDRELRLRLAFKAQDEARVRKYGSSPAVTISVVAA